MASLSDIVNVTISSATAAIKEPGFGTMLIADYHTRFTELIRFYDDLDGMVSDGFAVTDAAYMAAAAAFAQNPQPDRVAIGRRALAPTLQFDLYPTAVNSKAYKVIVTRPNGAEVSCSITSDSSATVAEICTALQVPIDAISDVVAVDNTTHVTVTASVAGSYFAVRVEDQSLLRVASSGSDPGIATDLAAIALASGDWYGLTLTTQGAAEVAAASNWAESNGKLFIQASQDGDIIGSGTSDIASTVQTANRFRTAIMFHPNPTQHAGAALMGATFPFDPGSLTFAFRPLASVDSVPLTPTQITNLQSKNCNYFTDYAGLSLTQQGKTAEGEWIDIIRDRDWFQSHLQIAVLAVKANNPKVPFTDKGIAQLEAAVRKATRDAIVAGFLAEGTDVYTVPKAADISANDKANRTLDAIRVSAEVAGAIHVTKIKVAITA
jgi:hypothetical protein